MQAPQVVHQWGSFRALAFCLAVIGALPLPVLAERFAVKLYTTADGLPRNAGPCIKRDSHGFLWFCTNEGFSRFDGYTFTNYGVEQGLPDPQVTDFLESRSGEYWVATANGLCRFNPRASDGTQEGAERKGPPASGPPMFEVFRPGTDDVARSITGILEDRDGSIWCGTLGGLYRFTPGAAGHFEYIAIGTGGQQVDALALDHEGALWIAVDKLLRRQSDGRMESYTERDGLPTWQHAFRTSDMLEDRDGRLWVAGWGGLFRLVAHPRPGRQVVERVYTPHDGLQYSPNGGLPPNSVGGLFQSLDGTFWASTRAALGELIPADGKRPERFRMYTATQGLNGGLMAEDVAGNTWLATPKGVLKWVRTGFTTYDVQDGLRGNTVSSVFEDRQGELCAVTEDAEDRARFINRFDGQRFVPIEPKVPGTIVHFTEGWNRIHFQDHTGAWWIPTDRGICRYPKLRRLEDLARTPPEAIYTSRDGLPGNAIFQLFEDSRGDVWISVVGPGVVTRWSRADGTFRNYGKITEGQELGTPLCFAEDHARNLWMGFFWHNLARYRNGRFDLFTTADGLPSGTIRSIYADHAGRLWLATSRGGLLRVDNPSATRPNFTGYTTAQGLSSNEASCVTEDAWGRIYVGTGRGVDRLDPQTGRIQHYTASEGLKLAPRVAFRDRQGALWFGGDGGVARLIPREEPQSTPPIRITSLRVRGLRYPVSELGETSLTIPTLAPSDNQMELGFASLNFAAGEVVRYQYKLEGTDRDWGPPTELRTVNYASLSPGSYRFLVRAVNSEGVFSARPAGVTFVILKPVWRRWWFLSLAALLAGLTIYAAYRYRLEHLLALERVRTRIATDLHDDIGSSLTQIAIMSEVARRDGAGEPLARIADLSRELVDSMSDIVWAINPKRDHLGDLAHRMRRFASDVLTAANIEVAFHVPPERADASLHSDVRREVFLVFKESINNIARHAQCKHVEVGLDLQGPQLLMRVCDDGQGFEVPQADVARPDVARASRPLWRERLARAKAEQRAEAQGHGLASMAERARRLGGHLEIASEPRKGTTVTLTVPVT